MCAQPVTQSVIHARLPARPRGAEGGQHIGAVADGDGLFGGGDLLAAWLKHGPR